MLEALPRPADAYDRVARADVDPGAGSPLLELRERSARALVPAVLGAVEFDVASARSIAD